MSKVTLRNFIIASLLLLVTGAAFGLIVYKTNMLEVALREQLTALKIDSERESTLYRLQKISDDSKSDREQLGSYFLPQASDSITFLNYIETLAPRHGVTLKTESLEEASDKKTKQAWIQASFTFSGSERDVEEFVKILETVPYLSYVTELSLAARAADNWEANIGMRVYLSKYE